MIYVSLAIALGLTLLLYWFKRPAIGLIAAGFWIVMALISYNLSVATWDINYGVFWLGIAAAIVVALEAFVVRPHKEDLEPEELAQDDEDEYINKIENHRAKLDKARRVTNRGRRRNYETEEEKKARIRSMLLEK